MKKQTESDLVRQCLDWLKLHKIFAWRSNNVGVFDPARKCFRSFTGLKGVSDILGILPEGRLLAVECKIGKNKLTPEQEWFLAEVNRLGGVGLEVRCLASLEQAMKITMTWGDGSTHNMLSTTHPDTVAAAVVRGDLITGQTLTPKWQRLAREVTKAKVDLESLSRKAVDRYIDWQNSPGFDNLRLSKFQDVMDDLQKWLRIPYRPEAE